MVVLVSGYLIYEQKPSLLFKDNGEFTADWRAGLLRRRIPGAVAASGESGRTDSVRTVLYRRASGLYARALLLSGKSRREPDLRGHVRQRRQPAQCRQHGHSICPKLYSDALRFLLCP